MDPEGARDAGNDPARWEQYFERSIDAVIAVSREPTRRARARTGVFAALPLTDDFVAVICSPNQGKDGEEWLRRCVDEPLFSALFPNLSYGSCVDHLHLSPRAPVPERGNPRRCGRGRASSGWPIGIRRLSATSGLRTLTWLPA
jgi:hypothetical protein